MAPIWCLPRPFSKKLLFQKRSLKPNKFWKFQIFFFISGSNFIGVFNGTLFVFIISVVAGAQKETFLPVHLNWPPLYFLFLIDCTLSPNGFINATMQLCIFKELKICLFCLKVQWWPIETRWQKHSLLCLSNHWDYENKQCTIKKPYEIATRNEKHIFEMFKICWF